MGVRNDLYRNPIFPKPLPYAYSVRDALPYMRFVRHNATPAGRYEDAGLRAAPTIVQSEANTTHTAKLSSGGWCIGPLEPGTETVFLADDGRNDLRVARENDAKRRRKFSIAELKRICGFPDDFVLTGTYAQQWERLGRAVPPVMMARVARAVEEVLRDN
jgi:DNA (cytosine-5)-methyltransferase 1